MIFDSNSRYAASGYFYRENREEGSPSFDLVTATRPRNISTKAISHVCVEGDNFRVLSKIYLGSEQFWWSMADANPDIDPVQGCFSLQEGSIVFVPTESYTSSY